MGARFVFMKGQSECHFTYDVREVSADWDRIHKDEFQVSILKRWNVCAALSYKLLSIRSETEVRAEAISSDTSANEDN
jgi:hypothetical protein